MGDLMRPVPFKELINRIFGEYRAAGSIFGIPKEQFFHPQYGKRISVFDEECATPLGPAAGPHTQLAQNIVASYLTGGRFMELKTVQILDTLEVEKPCIDAEDEGFNTEWSSEYTLTKAYDEYIKAWFLLYLLEEVFHLKKGEGGTFIFNMSVGYDLEGIKNPRVDAFINDLIDSDSSNVFQTYIAELDSLIDEGNFLKGTGLEVRTGVLSGLTGRIPSKICSQVTLSTMHGCPPKEIEAICNYMLKDKGLNTFVKLNPTLLGFKEVRKILDGLGFGYVALKEESFGHDLQYSDAVPMLSRLSAVSREEGLQFGMKLSNTLGSVNDKGVLPGDEMYMSGRALFPLTVNLASRLSNEFDGKLPISYAGGASLLNVSDIFETGIRPITIATDLLQPGGYFRMLEIARLLDGSSSWEMKTINLGKLEKLADASLSLDYTQKSWRGHDRAEVDEKLPLFDCYIAPCITACPIHQDIPEYISLVGQKKYAEAVNVIYENNALPAITGEICAHQCMYKCTRLDYEGTVEIREIKKIAVENGFAGYRSGWKKPEHTRNARVAVIGAGSAGLSAAYFLSREGFPVTVFDRRESAGGVVEYVVPNFRIPRETIESDIEFIKAHGVEFVFGASPDFSIADIRQKGFDYVCVAIGAESVRGFPIEGDNTNIIPSWDFLNRFNQEPDGVPLGKSVVVVGAGDTAMDAARAALRTRGVEQVSVVYRRSEAEVPASPEEYELALEDNIPFHFLRNPERYDSDGTLTLRVMELGEPDKSGRRKPEPTDRTETMKADTVIPSIGESADVKMLEAAGLAVDSRGKIATDESHQTGDENVFLIGDIRTGPSTIVECIADGRRAADALCRKVDPVWSRKKTFGRLEGVGEEKGIMEKKGLIKPPIDPRNSYDIESFAAVEAVRCLECNYICNKCVDVCPNRANIAIRVKGEGLKDQFQIVHIDAYCNECGDCGTFCPYEGRPYVDKLTVFNMSEDFENSENPGFLLADPDVAVRFNGEVFKLTLSSRGKIDGTWPSGVEAEHVKRVISTIVTDYSYLLGPVLE